MIGGEFCRHFSFPGHHNSVLSPVGILSLLFHKGKLALSFFFNMKIYFFKDFILGGRGEGR